jgi:hypothetical protein
MKLDSLPSGYVEPKKIELASNKLENVKAILEVNGNIPILIGDGDQPRIWLYIPSNNEGTEWYPLIKDNFSTNSSVLVMGGKNSVTIASPKGNILECKKRADGVIEISKLDLRIIGLDFVAADDTVKFMGSSFSRNIFKNVRVMFGVGNS